MDRQVARTRSTGTGVQQVGEGKYSLHVVGGMLGGVGVEVLRGNGANLPLLHDLVQGD